MPRHFTCNDAGVFTETTGDEVQQFSNVKVLRRFAVKHSGCGDLFILTGLRRSGAFVFATLAGGNTARVRAPEPSGLGG
jgi:hypothetical protein